MIAHYCIGDRKVYTHLVTEADTATFATGQVHAVYATFALARDAEWAGRLFVLDMCEAHEEGIGTFVHVHHLAPAWAGETVEIIATIDELEHHKIHCSFTAHVGNRHIASGRTGQKIIAREKLNTYFASLKS